mgnify:CR=1 FL=1
MDCTDRHERYFLRMLSKNVMLYTEMIVSKSAIYGDRKKILGFNEIEKPLALQVGGSEIEDLSKASKTKSNIPHVPFVDELANPLFNTLPPTKSLGATVEALPPTLPGCEASYVFIFVISLFAIDKFIKGSICGLANLKIATGIQGKVLTYMSYGLPVICSDKAAQNFNKNVISYKENHDLTLKHIPTYTYFYCLSLVLDYLLKRFSNSIETQTYIHIYVYTLLI